MVHNGIEYGLMAAYAEGLNVLRHAGIGKHSHEKDAETTPLRNPEHYQYDFNLADVTELWRRGSVISSWLLDLTAQALASDPTLDKFGGVVADSGEGRWTVAAANDEGVPAFVLTAALFERFGRAISICFKTRCCRRCVLVSAATSRRNSCMEKPRSDALVFFGASGDLAYKKIFPALQGMARRGKLDFPVVGVARSDGRWISSSSVLVPRWPSTAAASIPRPFPNSLRSCAT
jgi:6-phosphogluconate dehydrogenase